MKASNLNCLVITIISALILSIHLSSLTLSAQITLNEKGKPEGHLFTNKEDLTFFEQGTELIRSGNYKRADSILTLALCSYKDKSVFINRAIARMLLNDTIEGCLDLETAAHVYFDKQAGSLYNRYCCKKVDTLYYDKKINASDKNNFRYIEEIKYSKNGTSIKGFIYDKKTENLIMNYGSGCYSNNTGLNFNTTNLIALYDLIDSSKYYSIAPTRPKITQLEKYNDVKNRAKILLNNKYGYVKKDNGLDQLTIYSKITVLKDGTIKDISIIETKPLINIEHIESDLKNDIINIISIYPKFTPALLFKENINFYLVEQFEF